MYVTMYNYIHERGKKVFFLIPESFLVFTMVVQTNIKYAHIQNFIERSLFVWGVE